mgnify:CR=1 FL=1
MMKAQTGEGTGTFHMENFRRRSRYAAVFAVLAAALFAILILNINTGTTNIPVSRILKIIFLREGAQGLGIQYYLEDPNAASSDGGDPGRCTVPFRISVTDLF